MKRIPTAPHQAKFNAAKLRFKAPSARYVNTFHDFWSRLGQIDASIFGARCSKSSNGSIRWTFPKPKNSDLWWQLAIITVICITFGYISLFSIILAP